MKASLVFVGLIYLAGVLLFIPAIGSDVSGRKVETAPATLPASLEPLYPPQSPAPVYLLSMLGMAGAFSGMVCDVVENDMENVRMNFESFKKAYFENSVMIPEWKEKYPAEPVENLGAAIASGELSRIMPAVEKVGAVCHGCHINLMVPVQQKYRWHNFAAITMADPLSGQDVSFAKLMLLMETNFDGIANNIGQKQWAGAIGQFEAFKARFQTMAEACMNCHDSERHYYVSDDITRLISNLQLELNKPEVETSLVTKLLNAIGQESCSKCHLVHIPAAYGQQILKAH